MYDKINESTPDTLDSKVASVFPGRFVKKDLVRRVKAGAYIPVFVLEYLLSRYCSSTEKEIIEEGLGHVNEIIAERFVRPEESTKAQSRVKELGKHTIIDKIRVRLTPSEDKYWAELLNFSHRYVHIHDYFIKVYERLLQGGLWAQIELSYAYDEEQRSAKRSPFHVQSLKPIQIATFKMSEYCKGRGEFTSDDWLDLLIRSIGIEPTLFDKRKKLLFISRLIPFVETNFNLVELGPRGTGKSFVFQEISPYSILLTGPTTVANLFYNMRTQEIGLVGTWDVVAFDEVADLEKMPKEVITTLKTYCESGMFARGRETHQGRTSLALFGNTNQPVDVLVRTSHLFAPMPSLVRSDMAFLDRLHFYLPGWEMPKMENRFLTSHYGLVVDYLAEAFKELRKQNFTEVLDRFFRLGTHLNTRDVKAVRKTVSGLIKLLNPSGKVNREDLECYLELALEGRRRVKEQLKKIGAFEYYKTSFSYIEEESENEKFVAVTEIGGTHLISSDPFPAGSVYAASVGTDGKVAFYRLEVVTSPGSGKIKISGAIDSTLRQSVQTAWSYLSSRKEEMGLSEVFNSMDFHFQGIDLLSNREGCEASIAVFTAIYSAALKKPILPGLIILGDMTVQGNVKACRSLLEPLQLAMENGAKRVLLPTENRRHFLEVPADTMEKVDPIFYADPQTAAAKALGLH
ncbi:MAG: ATP-dependent Lon protease [Spirochaetes bacterium]|nr:MAG: ATP-dependent Lon protease [Spirochaetota bacterium]